MGFETLADLCAAPLSTATLLATWTAFTSIASAVKEEAATEDVRRLGTAGMNGRPPVRESGGESKAHGLSGGGGD